MRWWMPLARSGARGPWPAGRRALMRLPLLGAPADFAITSTWRLRARPEELTDVFLDTQALARWWSPVFLDVRDLGGGDRDGVGRRAACRTKGFLPYVLRIETCVLGHERGREFAIRTTGDLEGVCRAHLVAEQAHVRLRFDWRGRANRPLLQRLAAFAYPLLCWNHRWVMRMGRGGLEAELERRRRGLVAFPSHVPRPIHPTFPDGEPARTWLGRLATVHAAGTRRS